MNRKINFLFVIVLISANVIIQLKADIINDIPGDISNGTTIIKDITGDINSATNDLNDIFKDIAGDSSSGSNTNIPSNTQIPASLLTPQGQAQIICAKQAHSAALTSFQSSIIALTQAAINLGTVDLRSFIDSLELLSHNDSDILLTVYLNQLIAPYSLNQTANTQSSQTTAEQTTNQNLNQFFTSLISLVQAAITLGTSDFKSFILLLEHLANGDSDILLSAYLTQLTTKYSLPLP